MSFAQNLRAALNAKEMSQTQLARAINVSKSIISQYLKSTSAPRRETLEKIAAALDCDVGELLTEEKFEDDKESPSVSVAEAARALNKSEIFIRQALIQKTAPFGFAVKTHEGRYSYHISRKKLEEYI